MHIILDSVFTLLQLYIAPFQTKHITRNLVEPLGNDTKPYHEVL